MIDINTVGYAYILTGEYINCGFCVPACPCPGTIVWDDTLESYIRKDHCRACLQSGCEFYCLPVCPVDAIRIM